MEETEGRSARVADLYARLGRVLEGLSYEGVPMHQILGSVAMHFDDIDSVGKVKARLKERREGVL